MKNFVAVNPKQLDICLRLLYSENVRFHVEVKETNNRKIVYEIMGDADDETVEKLLEKYRILTA